MSSRLLLIMMSFCLAAACQTAVSSPPTSFYPPTLVSPSPTPHAVATQRLPTPTTSWQSIYPGIEQQRIEINDINGRLQEQLTIMRIDPAHYRFEVAYRPGEPLLMDEWLQQINALIVVNGGFFTPEYTATGRIIVDGQASGQSYGPSAGMVAISATGLEIHDLAQRPYTPDEPLQFGLQSFPVLIKPGGQGGYFESGEPNRRTVIAEDNSGRILFILAPFGSFSLAGMSHWLIKSDLDLAIALNLDGGTSTGMAVRGAEGVFGLTAVPSVIAVFPVMAQ